MSPILLLFALGAQTPPSPVELSFRTVAFGSNKNIKDGGAVVMRSAGEFAIYRKKMSTADQKMPSVDWSKEQVVAIHAAGADFGPATIQVVKVTRKADGSLQVDAAVERGPRPMINALNTTNSLNVTPTLHHDGLYTLIVVPPTKGAVTLRVVDPPTSSRDKSGTPGSR